MIHPAFPMEIIETEGVCLMMRLMTCTGKMRRSVAIFEVVMYLNRRRQ